VIGPWQAEGLRGGEFNEIQWGARCSK
jgi:hypothetical protein